MKKTGLRELLIVGTILCFLIPSAGFALEVYLPHLTGGATNWSDMLQVDNNSATTQTFTMTLFASGSQIYQNTFSVGGLGETTIEVKELSDTAEAGLITYTSSQLNFRLSYRNEVGGGVAEFRLTGDQYPILGFYFSDFISSISWKGIALANYGATTATANLYALGGGDILGSKTITISPDSKVSGIHTKWFPEVALGDIKKIIAVSASDLTGITICGDSTSSFLLFTPAAEVSDFSAGTVTTTDISGTWNGIWRSTDYIGESGSMVVTLVQTGSSFTGTGSFNNTDCGDVSGVPLSGTVSGSIVTINGTYNCGGNIATLAFTNGVVVGSSMAGSYQQNVNGQYYDAGTFTLTKQ